MAGRIPTFAEGGLGEDQDRTLGRIQIRHRTEESSLSHSLHPRVRAWNLHGLLRVNQRCCKLLSELGLPARSWEQSSCTTPCSCASCSWYRYFPQQLARFYSHGAFRARVWRSEFHHDNVQRVHSRGALGAATVPEPYNVSRSYLAARNH